MKVSVAIEQLQIEDNDINDLLSLQDDKPYCDNILAIVTDCNTPLYIFEGCSMKTIVEIFEQAPYLEMSWNEDDFKNTGEHLDITFIFVINGKWVV